MSKLSFTKMHGLGNDFMVVETIHQSFKPHPELIQALANRHTGVGFDQLLLVERSEHPENDFKYRIFNADGQEVEQCGNGARCFARFVYEKNLSAKQTLHVETAKGVIVPERIPDSNLVKVNMGLPKFAPADIPFITQQKTPPYTLEIDQQSVHFYVVNLGNPHLTIQVDLLDTAPVNTLGAKLETFSCFPERINVGFRQVISRSEIAVRIFERGVGETLSCGTGACAAVITGIHQGILDNTVTVHTRGGDLLINWFAGSPVWMTGTAETIFEGELNLNEYHYKISGH